MSSEETPNTSAFAEHAWKFIERGISVVPIAPGSKRPGKWDSADGWRGMGDWTRFAKRLPTDIELEHWYTWPDAGIGVVLGPLSNLVCLDKDYDLPGDGNDALQAIIPYSPVAKKGEKGWTRFYQYSGERSCSFDVGGARVLDVLSDGRQTVIPPTVHPSGCSYVWISEESLDSILSTNELPKLPPDFLAQVEKVLAPYQTEKDIKHQKKEVIQKESGGRINTDRSIQAEYFHDLNGTALNRLSDWVPRLIPTARPHNDGYRCIATWRNCTNPNVGIHHTGIKDWGGNYGMSAVDLVMCSNGLPFQKAAEALRDCLAMAEPAPIVLTVAGQAAHKSATVLMPWQKPAEVVTTPIPVMLPPVTSVEPAPAVPAFVGNPPGILGEISRWITATAQKQQPELSVAAAIALASVVMARHYRSQYGNFTSLYMVMIGKSTEGKEHPGAAVEKILTAAGLESLIGGSGYTSAGAVHSALLKSPAHLARIDELGKLLKTSRGQGQANAEAAIDKLIEVFGRLDGVMRPPTYSTMTLSKAQATGTERIVHNPGITLLGSTTPNTFYQSLTNDLVQDGFLGRCIVVESHQPRQLTRFGVQTPPPPHIVEWCKAVHISGEANRGNLVGVNPPDMPPTFIPLDFDEGCEAIMHRFERELNDEKDAAEGEQLDVVLGRTVEKAMRLAMITAKAMDVNAKKVMPHHIEWALRYVHYYDVALVRSVRRERISSQTDGDIKRAVKYIKAAKKYAKDARYGTICAQGGMPHSKLLKLMGMSAKQFNELMDTAVENGTVQKSAGTMFNTASAVYFVEE